MPNNTLEKWEEQTLGEICEKISAGGDKPDIFSDIKTDTCCIPIYSNGIKDNGLHGYTDKATIDKPAITVSARGTIGFVCKRLEPYCPIVRLISLIPKDYIDLSFLAYAMNLIIPQNTGTSIPQLTVPTLKTNKIKYPNIEEQQRIVRILDEAFENINQAKQNTLQNLNNTKELFDNNLYNLFTKNTELWEQDSLHNICEKISAGGDKPEVFSETKTTECNIPIYSNGIKDNGLYGYTNKSTIDKPAITISARGTIGFVCKRLEPYCPIVRLISLIPKDYIDLSFLAYAMSFVIPKNTGTSIPQLTVPNLKNSIVKYPPFEEQQKIVSQLDELQEQTKKLEQIYTQKLQDLDELKQSILQKAFKGEL